MGGAYFECKQEGRIIIIASVLLEAPLNLRWVCGQGSEVAPFPQNRSGFLLWNPLAQMYERVRRELERTYETS
jgi:hypothetical protein